MALRTIISFLISYLLGSVPFAYLFVKALSGKDLTREGTGNLGGRNVSRILGKGMAAVVIGLDMLKGALAVFIGQRVVDSSEPWMAFILMGAVLLGHNYSLFMGLKGGKGLASGFGALLIINPALLTILISGAVVTLVFTRDVYKAALTLIALFVPVTILLTPGQPGAWLASLLPAAVTLARHLKHLR